MYITDNFPQDYAEFFYVHKAINNSCDTYRTEKNVTDNKDLD